MLTFAAKYGQNITSQFGENGILGEIIHRIFPKDESRLAVEFGAPTKQYCSNIYPLNILWDKKWLDIDPQEFGIQKVTITPENINDLFQTPNLLSIDIDNDDYHIWKAYDASPEIVVIEVNSSLPPPMREIPGKRGASYMSMLELGMSKGYFLVCHTGNMIFVRKDFRHLFPEVIGDGLDNYNLYFNTSHL